MGLADDNGYDQPEVKIAPQVVGSLMNDEGYCVISPKVDGGESSPGDKGTDTQ